MLQGTAITQESPERRTPAPTGQCEAPQAARVRFATKSWTTESLFVSLWHVVQQEEAGAQEGHKGAMQSIMALHCASFETKFSMQPLQAAVLASVPRE
jgi:hypothetical protein